MWPAGHHAVLRVSPTGFRSPGTLRSPRRRPARGRRRGDRSGSRVSARVFDDLLEEVEGGLSALDVALHDDRSSQCDLHLVSEEPDYAVIGESPAARTAVVPAATVRMLEGSAVVGRAENLGASLVEHLVGYGFFLSRSMV